MEGFNFKESVNGVEDPEILKQIILALNAKIENLEDRMSKMSEGNNETENPETVSIRAQIIEQKHNRLEQIKHSITEITERMERPYVISAELMAVKEVLDVLSEDGDCNSVILEGEPGTGKTQWAYSEVGQEISDGEDVSLIHVRVKDTMRSQDLLYEIDDVRRLSDAQAKAQIPEEIRKEASLWKEKIIKGDIDPAEDSEYEKFKNKMNAISDLGETAKDLDYLNYVDLGQLGEAIYQSGKGKKVYLLVDEIEKGREELMTGILDEIENLTFTIKETGTVIQGDKKNLRIIITTNTEDADKIPPSFRRRSLYHYIDYPNRSDLAKIVELNFPNIKEELLNYALNVFYEYNNHSEIEKKPSTPELLSWIKVLSEDSEDNIPDDVPHKEILLKYKDDRDLDIGMLNAEVRESTERAEGELPHFVTRALNGEQIYHIVVDRINDESYQDHYSKFYANLHNEDVNFVTPQFEEEEEKDGYGDWVTVQVNTRNFQVIIPGVEHLGDGYYIIPDDKLSLFDDVIDKKTKILSADQKFTNIAEKNSDITVGKIEIDNHKCDAYKIDGNEKMIAVVYCNNE